MKHENRPKTKIITNGVKNLDKNIQQGKNSAIKLKEKMQDPQSQNDGNPTNRALGEIEQGANKAVELTKKPFQIKEKHISPVKQKENRLSQNTSNKAKPKKDVFAPGKRTGANTEYGKKQLIKNRTKTAQKTIKTTGKNSIKSTQKSVKTAERTAKTTIKTAKQAERAAKQGAKLAAKTAQKSAQVAKTTAKAAAKGVKATAKAVVYAIKAAIASMKALLSVIVSGGSVVIAILLAVVILLLIVSSAFGIFFSADANSGEGAITMQQAVQEINNDYLAKLAVIKQENPHDEVEMSGTTSVWKEVLAVYAAKVTTDPENPQEVATLTPEKVELLRKIFWDMNTISYSSETKEVTEIVVTDDGNGNLIETEVTTTKTFLYITVTHKDYNEAANFYNFNANQNELLNELMTPQYTELWSNVLTGINGSGGIGSGSIVEVVLSQVGNVNGDIYWQWYGLTSRTEWCAIFVSWCAEQCGYLENGIIPKFAMCQSQGVVWFKERSLWQERGYTPAVGDIIFFDWQGDGRSDHVGIVEKVENGRVYTIEGNSGNACKQNNYPLANIYIQGYGTPQY